MKKLLVDKNLTMQVRIDTGYHKLLKIEAAMSGTSIKTLIERFIADGLSKENVLGIPTPQKTIQVKNNQSRKE